MSTAIPRQGFGAVSGGIDPRWSKNGSEIYFLQSRAGDKELHAAAVQSDGRGGIKVGTPKPLFEFQSPNSASELNRWLYSPHPDGQRFLVSVRAESATPGIHLMTNWRRLLN